jgi:glycosyltransferase involved in cell wall biosynthesis
MIRVTVAIPTYNRPGFLRRALRSVQQQTRPPLEILVLDNGSHDSRWLELSELADPRVRTIRHALNIGQVNNWNAAIAQARGDGLCIFHDDDVMHPRYLEATARLLDAHPGVGMAFCQARRVDCMGLPLGIWWRTTRDGVITGSDYVLASLRNFGTLTLPSTALFRLSTCRAIGGFGGGLNTSAVDFAYFVRVAQRFDIGFTNEILCDYTLHPHQISEEFSRRDWIAGERDACLEVLQAGCWLLGQHTVADDTRREVAGILATATVRLTRRIRPRAQAGDAL